MVLVHLGLDESNHGRNPEVIAGVFSTRDSDVKLEYRKSRKKVNKEGLMRYFLSGFRSWKILAMPQHLIEEHTHPLAQALPIFLNRYLLSNQENFSLDILLDGEIQGLGRLRINLKEHFPNIEILRLRCFRKGNDHTLPYESSKIIRVADALASRAYYKLFRGKNFKEIDVPESHRLCVRPDIEEKRIFILDEKIFKRLFLKIR